MRFHWINIGRWSVGLARPQVVVEERPPKNWFCVNDLCIEGYEHKGRRLTADGCCPECGKSLRRIA